MISKLLFCILAIYLLSASGYAVGLIFDELSKDGQYQTVAVEVSDTNNRLAQKTHKKASKAAPFCCK
jgi:archaellum biogenesis protein FlaJ (TadC family)